MNSFNFPRGSIAVVGNGCKELGKGSGSAIDAHENIFRFHFYELKGFEQDYGTRCDYWVTSFYRSGWRYEDYRGVLCPLPLNDPKWRKYYVPAIYDNGHNLDLVEQVGGSVKYIPEYLYAALLTCNPHPSTGLALLWWMYHSDVLERVDVYGFDHFLIEETHYWQKGVKQAGHFPLMEQELFNKLFNKEIPCIRQPM